MRTRWAGCLAVVLSCLVAVKVSAEEPAVPIPDDAAANCADRVYIRAEYLLWWLKNANLPPLVSTGPIGGAPVPSMSVAPRMMSRL